MRFNIFYVDEFNKYYKDVCNLDPNKYWYQFLKLLEYKEIKYHNEFDRNWLSYLSFNYNIGSSKGTNFHQFKLQQNIAITLDQFNYLIEDIIRKQRKKTGESDLMEIVGFAKNSNSNEAIVYYNFFVLKKYEI